MIPRATERGALLALIAVGNLAIATPAHGQSSNAENKSSPCRLEASGELSGLYRGALRQELVLKGKCSGKLAELGKGKSVTFTADNLDAFDAVVDRFESTELPAESPEPPPGKPVAGKAASKGQSAPGITYATTLVLIVSKIPRELPASVKWTLASGGDPIADVTLRSFTGLSVVADDDHPRIQISYGERALDQLQSGRAVDGIAVITSVARSNVTRNALGGNGAAKNTASIAIEDDGGLATRARRATDALKARSDELKARSDENELNAVCDPVCAGSSGEALSSCTKECVDAERYARRAPWRVRPLTWQTTVAFWERGQNDDEYWNSEEARLHAIDAISFGVVGRQGDPLRVRVDLIEPTDPANSQNVERVLYSTELTLATRARAESLPLPIRDHLYVACGEDADLALAAPAVADVTDRDLDVARNGQTRAIDDSAIEGGECVLHYDPILPARVDKLVQVAGPQQIVVTLARDGASEVTRRWSLADPSHPAHITLPALENGSSGTGPYRVQAALDGAKNPDVTYRPPDSTQPPSSSSADVSAGALAFAARLRPRGATGWRSLPLRTFMTFPVEVFGFRVKARPRELHASSESTVIQSTSARVGVLAVVEPWDYDAGRNPVAVPVRFMSGLHLFDLANGTMAPAFVTGVSMTLPILDLPSGTVNNQLGTDVAIGAFWEVDLHEAQPFRDGNHLLITLGLNALSLFGSK